MPDKLLFPPNKEIEKRIDRFIRHRVVPMLTKKLNEKDIVRLVNNYKKIINGDRSFSSQIVLKTFPCRPSIHSK